jgi:antirestriction protein ArdC
MARKTSRKSSKGNNAKTKGGRKGGKGKFDVYQHITDAILTALDNGTVPWRKPWAGGSSNAPRNIRGTHYRGINVFVLMARQVAEGYRSNVWLSWKQAGDKGYTINPGAKPTIVVFWKFLNVDVDDEQTGETKRKTIPMLRYYNVYNIEQTDADVADIDESVVEPVEHDPIAECEAIVEAFADKPSITHGGNSACYSPSMDAIRMPERSAFGNVAEYYSTLFHECGHSTGHESRLDRDEITRAGITFGDHAYSREELVAEFTAAFLCGTAGIECQTIDNSAAYIAHWSKVLKADNKLVVTAAQRAQKAADYIVGKTFDHAERAAA